MGRPVFWGLAVRLDMYLTSELRTTDRIVARWRQGRRNDAYNTRKRIQEMHAVSELIAVLLI